MAQSQGGQAVSNFHLQEIQTLQNSLRERKEYVTELENRLRALWDKYDGDRKHYMDRIKRLEEAGNALLWYFCPKNTGDISFLQSEAIKQWNKAKEAKL
jgi:hypothetical protein